MAALPYHLQLTVNRSVSYLQFQRQTSNNYVVLPIHCYCIVMFTGLSYPCSILCRLKNEREIDIDFTNYYWLMTKVNFIFHFPLVRLLVYANISKWWGDGGKGGGVEVKAFRNYSGNGLYVWN